MDMISFGSVFLELVFGHVPALPGPGEEVYTDEFAVSCGGAVTSASAAARAGAQAGLCTVLGDDLGSGVVAEFCAGLGVDLTFSRRVQRPSAGITVVLNFDGDRAFVTHNPPRPPGEQSEVRRWLGVLRSSAPRWAYLHGGAGVPEVLRQARAQGTQTVLDVSLGDEQHMRDQVIECVRLADLFVPNEAEIQRLTGTASTEAAVAAAAAWGTTMVITRGARGALIAGPDGVTEVSDGVRQVTVRDLTGAGDNFAGAMIGALVQGMPLARAAAAANAAAAESVTRPGAVGEVEVAGFSSASRTAGALVAEQLAVAAVQGAVAAIAGQQDDRDRTADEQAAGN